MTKVWEFFSGRKMAIGFLLRAALLAIVQIGWLTAEQAAPLLAVADYIMGGGAAHKLVKGELRIKSLFNPKQDY